MKYLRLQGSHSKTVELKAIALVPKTFVRRHFGEIIVRHNGQSIIFAKNKFVPTASVGISRENWEFNKPKSLWKYYVNSTICAFFEIKN